jgi:hypothetical protein
MSRNLKRQEMNEDWMMRNDNLSYSREIESSLNIRLFKTRPVMFHALVAIFEADFPQGSA